MIKAGVWTDVTSYSQGDKDRVPSCWSISLTRDIKVTVLTSHIYYKGKWVMHARPWYDTKEMQLPPEATKEEAQKMALAMVKARVDELVGAIAQTSGQ